MAQRDPLVEYQREGYDMFRGMLDGLKEESVGFLFNVAVEAAPEPVPSVSPATEVQVAAAARQLAAARATRNGDAPAAAALPAAPLPAPAVPVPAQPPAPLRAKGLDERSAPALTYSGPDEDGGTAVSAGPAAARSAGAGAPVPRRERRAAARTQAKGAKPPKRKK